MGVRKKSVLRMTMYISRTSEKREASVKIRKPTPVEKPIARRMEIGTNHQVGGNGKRRTRRIAPRGSIDSTRFTRATPTDDTTKTERGTKIRFAISLASSVWAAA